MVKQTYIHDTKSLHAIQLSNVPSPEGALRTFQASSTIAVIGFLSLLVQTLLGTYRKWKRKTKIKKPVALSAVTSGDEAQKPTTPDGGSSGPTKAEPDHPREKRLHDRIDALIAQARSPGSDDTTPHIARVAAAYLLAGENLLRLRRGGSDGGGTRRTLQALLDDAIRVIDDTTAATASLRELRPLDRHEVAGAGALLAGTVSGIAALIAFMAATQAESMVFGNQNVDLTRLILRGEPREGPPMAFLPLYLLAIVVCAAARAFLVVVWGLGTVLRLAGPVVLWPANAVFSCLASGLLLVGLPLSIVGVHIISTLAIFAMLIFAIASSFASVEELKDELDASDG